MFTNMVRYAVARFGYSPAVFAWELFNEQDLVTNYLAYNQSALAWHKKFYRIFISLFLYLFWMTLLRNREEFRC